MNLGYDTQIFMHQKKNDQIPRSRAIYSRNIHLIINHLYRKCGYSFYSPICLKVYYVFFIVHIDIRNFKTSQTDRNQLTKTGDHAVYQSRQQDIPSDISWLVFTLELRQKKLTDNFLLIQTFRD